MSIKMQRQICNAFPDNPIIRDLMSAHGRRPHDQYNLTSHPMGYVVSIIDDDYAITWTLMSSSLEIGCMAVDGTFLTFYVEEILSDQWVLSMCIDEEYHFDRKGREFPPFDISIDNQDLWCIPTPVDPFQPQIWLDLCEQDNTKRALQQLYSVY